MRFHVSRPGMDRGSLDAALLRIEAAMARIEKAADRSRNGRDDLGERHEQLKLAVARSLQELDTLIAAQAAGKPGR